MPATNEKKYALTEPPKVLTESLTLKLDSCAMDKLNAYRQAKHAYFSYFSDNSTTEAIDLKKVEVLVREKDFAAEQLASYLSTCVQQDIGEPEPWVAARAE